MKLVEKMKWMIRGVALPSGAAVQTGLSAALVAVLVAQLAGCALKSPVPRSVVVESPATVPVLAPAADADRPGPDGQPPSRTDARAQANFFQHYGVNPTIETSAEPKSTFAVDVDTASYAVTRAFLERGSLPDEAAVRVEEFVNAFDYGYRPPEHEAFGVQVEVFPSPTRKGFHVLQVGVKGKEVRPDQRKPANLVFTIDVSGSMNLENRLGLVKRALAMLVGELDARDTVTVVVYGDTAHLVLPPTSATEKARILAAIERLEPEGSTNVQAGLDLAYDAALKHFVPGGINRVVLCSDGVANNGVTEAGGIWARVKGKASEGITLSTVGFGMGNYNDVLMEKLADAGDGNYAYVDRLEEAHRVFVENLTGTLQVIAKDVKLQLEFDPSVVERYRLLGFENRALAARDFANDKVDAGDIGAGHSVTALYEVKLKRRDAASFATFRARYKAPEGGPSKLVERALPMSVVRDDVAASSGTARLALVSAGFAEKLRGSYWVRALTWETLLAQWQALPVELRTRKDVAELKDLIVTAQHLDRRPDRFEREMPLAKMSWDDVPVLAD